MLFDAAFERVCGASLRSQLCAWRYRRGTLYLEFSHHAAVAEAGFFAEGLRQELNRLLGERLAAERDDARGRGRERPVIGRIRLSAAGTENS